MVDWKDELLVESTHVGGAGGQVVGYSPQSCGVRVTHLPTGMTACCWTKRSQHKNREVATSMVEFGLLESGEL